MKFPYHKERISFDSGALIYSSKLIKFKLN